MAYVKREINRNEGYRFSGGNLENFAGNFCTVLHHRVYELIYLDSFDLEFVSLVPLKEGEKIFRYQTDRSRIAGISPLVKVNLRSGLAYYLIENTDVPVFETRGIRMKYANIVID